MSSLDSSIDSCSENKGNFFEVEKILGKKTREGTIYYKIKWKGFSLNESTWEPKHNLALASRLVKNYERKLLQEKRNRISNKQKQNQVKKETTKVISIKSDDENSTEMSNQDKSFKNNKMIYEIKSNEGIEIIELFKLEGKLYAKIETKSSFRKEGIVIKKEKIVLTKELYEKAPIKLLEYYEERIMKNTLKIKSIK